MAFTVFGAQIANNDVELVGTDGTSGRTFLIKNINPGGSGNVTNSTFNGGVAPFAVVGNLAYFSADDGTGQELWRTDGTNAGTTRVTDFFTNNGTAGVPEDDVKGYAPFNILAANGYVVFLGSGPAASNASTSPARYGVWKYDPGTGGTTYIADNPGIVSMAAAGTRVYWTYDGGSGSGLVSSNGVTAASTLYSTGSLNSPPGALYNAGGTLYLGIGGIGGGIKKVVGTTVSDVSGGPNGPLGFIHTSSHVYIISSDNKLYITTTGSNTATQITHPSLTFDFSYNGPAVHVPGFAALGNKLVFSNNKTTNTGFGAGTGSEVWITDGTGAGTGILKDIVTGSGSSNPHVLL